MTLFGRMFRDHNPTKKLKKKLEELAKRHSVAHIDLAASYAELRARNLSEAESLAVLETAEVLKRSNPESARNLINLAPVGAAVCMDRTELRVLQDTVRAQAERIRELEAEQQEQREQPGMIPPGRCFYLLWSPTGKTPPRRVMLTAEEADQAGFRMSQSHPTEAFYALKAVSLYQVDRPVKSELVEIDDIPF